MEFDIRIIGGTIVDGTGAPGYRGDVGIKDGRITALDKATRSAETTIEADGMIVCPGFVDIHTHYDAQIMWDPMLTFSPWHGVTTCVMGNCGFGLAPTRPEHRDIIMLTLEKVEGCYVMLGLALCSPRGLRRKQQTPGVDERQDDRHHLASDLLHFHGQKWSV